MARTIRSRAIAAFFLLTLFGLILPARAATITVDSATDDGTGGCTLREAVESAETDAAVGGCATGTAGSDTIIFDAGLTGMTITLTQNTGVAFFGNTAMDVNTIIIIDGSGAPGLVIDANGDKRHFGVNGTGDLTLQFITLTGGLAQGEAGGRPAGPAAAYGGGGGGAGFGGAIYNNGGTLAVANSTLMGNTAQGGSGGAIGAAGNSAGGGPNGGMLTLPRGPAGEGGFGSGGSGGGQEGHSGGGSGVGGAGGFGGGGGGGGADSDPAPGGQPGGPGGFGGGTGSTGSACSICGDNAFGGGASGGPGAGMGGGIFNQGGTVTVRNSTISGNTAEGPGSASGYGGGIFNYNGTLTTTNVTVNNNTANDGGGIYNMGDGATATATINNTIVANSSAGDDFVGGTLNTGTNTTSGVGNLMENHTGFTGTVASTSDPDLAVLADNGGPTQTHLQSETSPVIDGGNNAAAVSLTTDQRGTGFARVEDGTVDIGAVERSVCDPLIVTNTSDSGCGSLREAINAANSNPDVNTISFDIPGAGPHTIQPGSALPAITAPVVLDGATQPGNAGVCSNSIASRPSYAIILDGANTFDDGLLLDSGSDGSTIRGLNVRRFPNAGLILMSNNNIIACNFVGTDEDGDADMGNNFGIVISGASNEIGGMTAEAGNLVSGSDLQGVSVSSASAMGNKVQGNYIGTNASGTAALENLVGVSIVNAPSNEIGGTDTGAGNLISGNNQQGVFISSTDATGNKVLGNKIGTDASGTAALSNFTGIHIVGTATGNSIGGTAAGAGNLISGNTAQGVSIASSGSNEVLGNYIGTDVSGTVDLGNGSNGVYINGSSSNEIGGIAAGAGNLISGNAQNGVYIAGSSATGNRLLSNMIGTDASGTADLGNSSSGVYIEDAPSNEIGGTAAGEGNTVAFNGTSGITVTGDVSLQNAILSNAIFQNTALGIDLGDDAVTGNDPGDTDDGPNKLQNWPLVTTITDAGGGNFEVTYSVDTDPANATYPLRIEFFISDMDEQEGQTFIASDTYTAGDFAMGEKTITLTPGGAFSALVATATDDDGNTSEFSVPLPVITAEKTFSLSEGDDGIAQPGETVSYTITLTNDGSGSTAGLTFSDDALDGSLALACASVVPTPDTCTDGLGGSFSYNAGTLAELGILGDMVTITFDAVVENPISVGVESVSNQGTASGDNFPDTLTDDPDDPTSSADPTVIPVDAAAVVMATKTDALVIDHDGDGRADPGDTIEYTITVTNTGDQDVADVFVTDTVDPHTELECPVSPGVGTQVSCTPGAGGTFVVDLTTIDGEPRLLTPKASQALTFRVVVASPFPAGTGTVENQATVEYTGENGTEQTLTDDPDTPAPMDPTATEIDLSADLLLRKTASTPMPDYLSNVVFTLTLENLGPANGATAEVKDALPKGLVFVSATGDGSYNPDTGRWDVAGINVGTPVSIQITVRVETIQPVTNTATIIKTRLRDENPSNNTDSTTITPVASDLSLEKRLSAYTEDASLVTATFTLMATNEGPSDATGVVVTDLLDEDATLVSTSFSDATDTYNATTGAWTLGTLAVGETATLVMTLTADARSFVLNYAEIAGDQVDQNARNNVSAVVIGRDIPDPARFRSDLSLEKTVSEANPPLGSQVVYTLTVANGGPFTTAGVEATDLLPSGVTFVSAQFSDEADSYDAETGLWVIGALPDGAVAQLQITVEVTGSGEITNTAEVTGNHLPDVDSEPGNGEADEDDQARATISVGGVAGEKATDTEASVDAAVPTAYTLYGNYPNPFNPATTIPYGVPQASAVRLAVYDLLGREVAVLVEGTVSAGRYEVVWEAGAHPTGLYLVRMEAEGHVVTRRITLMK